jgi:hypothetical protein
MNIDHSFELGHSYQNSMQGYHDCGPPPNKESYSLPMDLPSELRTASPVRGLGAGFFLDADASVQEICNTINPHVFHMTCLQGLGIDSSGSPFQEMFPGTAASVTDNDETFGWMAHGFGNQMSFAQTMRMQPTIPRPWHEGQ